jgi:hypothetical protein
VILDVQVVMRLNPLAPGFLGGKPRGSPAHLLPRRQHVWRGCQGLTGRHVQGQPGVQTARLVNGEPVADGVAVNAQALGHRLTRLRVAAGQQIAPLPPAFLTPMLCTLEPRLEGLCLFGKDR